MVDATPRKPRIVFCGLRSSWAPLRCPWHQWKTMAFTGRYPRVTPVPGTSRGDISKCDGFAWLQACLCFIWESDTGSREESEPFPRSRLKAGAAAPARCPTQVAETRVPGASPSAVPGVSQAGRPEGEQVGLDLAGRYGAQNAAPQHWPRGPSHSKTLKTEVSLPLGQLLVAGGGHRVAGSVSRSRVMSSVWRPRLWPSDVTWEPHPNTSCHLAPHQLLYLVTDTFAGQSQAGLQLWSLGVESVLSTWSHRGVGGPVALSSQGRRSTQAAVCAGVATAERT